MVVTSRFHQLRSHLTFRCAVRQRLPAARQPQARPCFYPNPKPNPTLPLPLAGAVAG